MTAGAGDYPRPQPPRDLTIPEPGSETARAILNLSLRRLLADLRALRTVPGASREAIDGWRALREVLATIGASHPGAIPSLLRRPTVAAPLRCLRDGSADAERCLVEVTGQAAFELALHRALPGPLLLRRLPPRLLSLSRRLAVDVPPEAGDAVFGGGRLEIDGRPVDLPSEALRPYHDVADDLVLATADNNPLATVEAHPDKSGNAIDLGGQPVAAWVAALGEALTRIGRHLPDLRRELRMVVQQLVPVGFDAERHLSASYREAIGTVYLTLHPSPMTMTEAVIHEFAHNKLNAMLELDPLIENGAEARFASPVRPDPRPLTGVLLAVHAFLPVARLYERMLQAGAPEASAPGFRDRFFEIVRSNRDGAAVLFEHARPTPVGGGLLDEIRRWDDHYRRLDIGPAA